MCLVGLFISCKQAESCTWDADGIRYESGKSITSSDQYKRIEGTTGIIGSFSYATRTYRKQWYFYDSNSDTAEFEYFYEDPNGPFRNYGTYKIYIGDDGYFVIELSYKSGSFYKYRYYADENYLIMQE